MSVPTVGAVGCGGIANSAHLPAWQALAAEGRCRLVGVTDRDANRTSATAQRFGTRAFASVEALLRDGRPQIVSIATLLDQHHDLAILAFHHGCHVLCEKPIARNAAEAAAMVLAAQRANRLLGICLQSRQLPEARHLKQQLASGALGGPLTVRTWGGGERSLPVNRPWPSGGGGVLNHWTIHSIDLALWLMDYPTPLTASASGYHRLSRIGVGSVPMLGGVQPTRTVPEEVEDLGLAFVRLANGATLTVEANFLQPPSARPSGYEILTERGAASLNPLTVRRDDGERWTDLTPAAGELAPPAVGMQGLMGEFLAAVAGDGPPTITGSEVVTLQHLMDAIYASVRSGHEVPVAS